MEDNISRSVFHKVNTLHKVMSNIEGIMACGIFVESNPKIHKYEIIITPSYVVNFNGAQHSYSIVIEYGINELPLGEKDMSLFTN